MAKQKITINPYMNTGTFIVPGAGQKKPTSSTRSDVKPQFVHNLTPKPPPEISSNVPKQDFKQKCVKFAVAAVICLLLLVLVVGILLAYYFSSSCVHGLQCGDGSCVWESQWCDGVRDCPSGQDESNCVRLHGSSFLLQIYSTRTKTWRSVCSHGWSEQQSRTSCRTIGYKGTYVRSDQQMTDSDEGFLKVKSGFNPDVFILQQLELSNTCPNNTVVTLRCADCGSGVNSSRSSRGQQVSLGSWPWQVSLQVSGIHRCGGAIISPYWIVTAAHCVFRFSSPGNWAVYAGIVDPLGSLFNPAHSVSLIVAHEHYNNVYRRNDIALMRLTKPLDITASIKPVCLPNVGLNFSVDQTSWITRFTHRGDGVSGSLYLTEAQVSVVETSECNSSVAYNGRISQDMICARETEAGTVTCHLDGGGGGGGGPLVTLNDGLWWLIGDNVWGEKCAAQNKPGVYGNIIYFLDWIYHQMKKHQDD